MQILRSIDWSLVRELGEMLALVGLGLGMSYFFLWVATL